MGEIHSWSLDLTLEIVLCVLALHKVGGKADSYCDDTSQAQLMAFSPPSTERSKAGWLS